MPTSSHTTGWIVIGSGAAVLVARHLMPWIAPQVQIPATLLTVASAAAYLAMAAGVFLTFGGRSPAPPVTPPAAPPPAPASPPEPPAPATPDADDEAAAVVLETALHWAEELDDESDPWRSFDQLVRELFVEYAGASRVRLFVPREQGLVPLGLDGTPADHADQPPVEDPILTQAAATGREYFAADREPPGPEMGDSGEWAWVVPVRFRGRVLGVAAAGRVDPLAPPDASRRRLMAALIAWLWSYAQTRHELGQTRQIDKASGVLTRPDFFARAASIIEESQTAHEPFVVVAVAIEGLRRLDDQGLWDARDRLIEAIGHEIRSRMRSDDLIGRFSDDRFVMLLRRLDRGLGVLIARKVLEGVGGYLRQHASSWGSISVRAAVAGGAPEAAEFETVLIAALEGIERARREGCALVEVATPGSRKEDRA